MRTPASHSDSLSSGYLPVVDQKSSFAKTGIEIHKTLLCEIVSGMGFSPVESSKILEEVFVQSEKRFADYSGIIPFKLWLAKMLVRKCIFRISENFFNGQANVQVKSATFLSYSTGKSIFDTGQKQMPLSFWVVHLLHNRIGFTEREIAQILNTTPVNVSERLKNVLSFIPRA